VKALQCDQYTPGAIFVNEEQLWISAIRSKGQVKVNQ
jgi:hypothetical protein